MPKNIFIAGAGKSSASLINHLLGKADAADWYIIVADASLAAAAQKIKGHPRGTAVQLDINNATERSALVATADLVLSLMPPALHVLLAEDCLKERKHLITSSYISTQMAAMDEAVKDAGLMFMCEMGLDPGIDHMTAMQILDDIHERGGKLIAFKSYCGGLVAPESDDNPWHYKFTWNPRNIITAGSDGAQYLENGAEKRVGYKDMFISREPIHVEGLGDLAYYPNRDSLHYIQLYNVPEVVDFMRATLRYASFCTGWNALLQAGFTDTNIQKNVSGMTTRHWVADTLQCSPEDVEDCLRKMDSVHDDELMEMLAWLGLFKDDPLPVAHGTNGDILLSILMKKWEMKASDKDMVVMQHEVVYDADGTRSQLISSMIVIGDDSEETAMAKTVGLPMALLAEGILNGTIKPVPGVNIPVQKSIYMPLLAGLSALNITFRDNVRTIAP